MFFNYLKISIRNLLRHKTYSLINIGGLTIGILCCLLLTLFVRYEWSFDSFQTHADRIYRITEYQKFPGKDRQHVGCTAGLMAPAMEREYPEVIAASRLGNWGGYTLTIDGKSESIQRTVYADANFFTFFGFTLLSGDPATVLTQPYSLILTRSTATRLFGDRDPVGRSFPGPFGIPWTVTGIAEDPPEDSHIAFDALLSWSSTTTKATADHFTWMNNWRAQAVYSYLLLNRGVQASSLQAKFPDFLKRFMPERVGYFDLSLQPMLDIHLGSSDVIYDFNERKGDKATVVMMAWIAFFILLIACINFMNLATARSMQRAKEVGLRKVVGAHRGQVIGQFLGESVLLAVLSTGCAIVLLELLLPAFARLVGRTLSLNPFADPALFVTIVGTALLSGIVAGSYPAFYLSRFKPIDIMRSSSGGAGRGAGLRRILVVAQFSAAIALVIGTLVIRNQLDFVRNAALGFDREQLMWIRTPQSTDQLQTLRSSLIENPAILDVTASSRIPGRGMPTFAVFPVTGGDAQHWDLPIIGTDESFLKTYGIALREGRDFSKSMPSDRERAIIINETMMKKLSWKNPVGHQIRLQSPDAPPMTIIGVIRDFHTKSLHERIEPLLLQLGGDDMNYLTLRIRKGRSSEAVQWAESVWKHVSPDKEISYSFLDDDFSSLYRSDERTAEIVEIFSVLAIVVACLGLFGLSSFVAQQRTREVGIRKVLGSTSAGIVRLLTREFVLLVVAANLIAWPVAYLAMDRWLQDFAYRISLSSVTFLLAGGIALMIAIVTVAGQAIRASMTNPAEALRYE